MQFVGTNIMNILLQNLNFQYHKNVGALLSLPNTKDWIVSCISNDCSNPSNTIPIFSHKNQAYPSHSSPHKLGSECSTFGIYIQNHSSVPYTIDSFQEE